MNHISFKEVEKAAGSSSRKTLRLTLSFMSDAVNTI
jgi:hypothetical protein